MRRLLIWLLAVALLVYGQSSAIVQMLGPAHRHAVLLAPGLPAWMDSVAAVFQDIRTWRDHLQDHLHERLLLEEAVHGPAHRDESRRVQADAGAVRVTAEGSPGMHTPAVPHAHPHTHGHAHFHSLLQRHHHDPQDPSVVTLDRDGPDALADASAQAGAGSASLALGLAAPMTVPAPAVMLRAWRRPAAAAWEDALPRLPERPPRLA